MSGPHVHLALSRQALLVAAVLAAVVVMRLPSLTASFPIDDEATYVTVGRELAAGGQIYASGVERKPPLLLVVFGTIDAALGPYNLIAVHLCAALWVLLTMALVYRVARDAFDRETGLIAAALYQLFQQWWYASNLAFNGEVLMNLPLAAACFVGFRYLRHQRLVDLMAAGALCAIAGLLKQPGAASIVMVAALPALNGRPRIGRALRHTAVAVAGFAIPLLATAGWLYRAGALADAWYWTVGDHDVTYFFWTYAWQKTLHFAVACAPITIGAIYSVRRYAIWREHPAERRALLLLTLLSAIGTAASARFYPHYYIQLVLPLSLLAAPAARQILDGRLTPFGRRSAAIYVVVLITTTVVFAGVQWRGVRRAAPRHPLAVYMREHTGPGERIFVWGHATRLYVDAERRSSSRFVSTFPLTGRIFGTPQRRLDTSGRILAGAWGIFTRELEAQPPALIADVETGGDAAYPMRKFSWFNNWVSMHYQPVFRTAEGVVYERSNDGAAPRLSGAANQPAGRRGIATGSSRYRHLAPESPLQHRAARRAPGGARLRHLVRGGPVEPGARPGGVPHRVRPARPAGVGRHPLRRCPAR